MGDKRHLCIIGDIHGHLQLALCVAARWQAELGVRFDAVFLCGDVGTFTDHSQLDSTTRRHGKQNPCELEFLTQWSTDPQAPWLDYIFKPEEEDGLGLTCPVIMVSGNHEGFTHLKGLVHDKLPENAVKPNELPGVDTNSHIRLLPSGWRVALPSGCIVGAVGGIEAGQREANYHPMAYIDEDAVLHLMDRHVDLLLTHQGPAETQDTRGSSTLQLLLDATDARAWFHGHSITEPALIRSGQDRRCLLVPLGDIAFPGKGPNASEPGQDGWCLLTVESENIDVKKGTPPFLREFRRNKWLTHEDGRLISPTLVQVCWKTKHGKGD